MQKQRHKRQLVATFTALFFSASLLLPSIASARSPVVRIALIDINGNTNSDAADIHYFVEKGIRQAGPNIQLSPLDDVLNAGAQADDIQRIAFGQESLILGLEAFKRADYAGAIDQLEDTCTRFEQSFAFLPDTKQYLRALVHFGVALVRSKQRKAGIQILEKAFVLKPKLNFAEFQSEYSEFVAAKAAARARDTSEIVVATTPDGSRVFVDGGYRGVSTLVRRGRRKGVHFIRVERQGYARVGKMIDTRRIGKRKTTIKLEITLTEARKKALLDNLLPTLRVEFGDTSTGPGLQRIQNLLLLDHVILLRCSGVSNNMLVELALYNLNSGRLLKALKLTVDWSSRKKRNSFKNKVVSATKKLLNVDLHTVVKVPKKGTTQTGGSIFSTWWFWTAVGVVTVGTTVGIIYALQPDEPKPGLPNDGNGAMILRF
jgi:hypothetical protein